DQYTRSDGRGGAYAYKCMFAGAKLDLTGRGWLGFESIQISDQSVGSTDVREFNQAFPLTFTTATHTARRSADSTLMQAVTFDYDVLNPAPGVYLPLPTSVVNQMYTSGSSDFTQTTSYVYDDFGNPKQTQATTTDGGAALYTFEDYNND